MGVAIAIAALGSPSSPGVSVIALASPESHCLRASIAAYESPLLSGSCRHYLDSLSLSPWHCLRATIIAREPILPLRSYYRPLESPSSPGVAVVVWSRHCRLGIARESPSSPESCCRRFGVAWSRCRRLGVAVAAWEPPWPAGSSRHYLGIAVVGWSYRRRLVID